MRIIADYSEIDEICCAASTLVDGIYKHGSLAAFPDPAQFRLGLPAAESRRHGIYRLSVSAILVDTLNAITPGTIHPGVGVDDHIASMNFLPVSTE